MVKVDGSVGIPDWYREERRKVEAMFDQSTPWPPSVSPSPSGRDRIEVAEFATGPDTWSFSRGRITRVATSPEGTRRRSGGECVPSP